MPERCSVAVTISIVSPPSCTCGGSKPIERSCGGVVSEFGSFGSLVGVFGLLSGLGWFVPPEALAPAMLLCGRNPFGCRGGAAVGFTCGGAGFGCGASCCA